VNVTETPAASTNTLGTVLIPGSTTQVIFNDSGALAGAELVYNKTLGTLWTSLFSGGFHSNNFVVYNGNAGGGLTFYTTGITVAGYLTGNGGTLTWSGDTLTGLKLAAGSAGAGTTGITLNQNTRLYFNGSSTGNDYLTSLASTGISTPSSITATGGFIGNASTATALSTTGSAGQFWANNNTWQTPAGGGGGGLSGSGTGAVAWDPGSLAPGEYETKDVTVSGAVVGAPVATGFSVPLTTGMMLTSAVSAGNTVTATLWNFANSTQDLGAGTLTSIVVPTALTGSVAWNPANLASGNYATQDVTVTGATAGMVTVVAISEVLPAGMILTASITAADTATVLLWNFSGSDQNIAATTLTVKVVP
jgi:hypothetical protein